MGEGGTKSYKVVLTRELEVLAIMMGGGGAKNFNPLKGRMQNVLPCLEGGGQKVSDPRFSLFVDPASP